MTEVEKLKNAAELIEAVTGGRLRMCAGIGPSPYIRPADDAYLGLELRLAADHPAQRYRITFEATPRRMGASMDTAGIRELMEEIQQVYSVLMALELQDFRPTEADLRQFADGLKEQAQEPVRESGPTMNPTF